MKNVFIILFLLGLIYLILPSPKNIGDITDLPGSVRSDLPGDTIQNPNIAAYFSFYGRDFITNFYKQDLQRKDFLGKILPPIRLNHPPEEAFTYIRDQQESTFLEEYLYPFKESLYVNGYEPVVKNGRSIDREADNVIYNGNYYPMKTTIRLYSTSLVWRIIIYLGSWLLFLFSIRLISNVFKQY